MVVVVISSASWEVVVRKSMSGVVMVVSAEQFGFWVQVPSL